MFADILILRLQSNHDQILTYLIPAELASVEAGSLVAVPVRQQYEKGLILRLYMETPELKARLKSVHALLEPQPMLSQAALELAEWISDYYLCSLNKAVSLFLPPPVRQVAREILLLKENGCEPQLFSDTLENKILEYLKKNKGKQISVRQIINKFGKKAKSSLELLSKQELIYIQKEFRPQVKKKLQILYQLTEAAPDWRQVVKKAPRQGAILEDLQKETLSLQELQAKHGPIRAIMQTLLKKGWVASAQTPIDRSPSENRLAAKRAFLLNEQQLEVSRLIKAALLEKQRKVWLLHGVTGSGKTAVYLEAIAETLKQGRQVLYLVPEIALTPQITTQLLAVFGELVAILHSALAAGERHDEWRRIRRGEARVVLGPRSAVFAPFVDLGLIIVDEEHENTYKQNEPEPRYDARRVALKLAGSYGASVVMGSATPSLQAYYLAEQGVYQLLELAQRVEERPLPEMIVVDLKKEIKEGNRSIFSGYLRQALVETVASGEQAILFMNRRGYHTFVLCRECGNSLSCPRCDISLTYHQSKNRLVCHYCNFQRQLPQNCPSCGSRFIRYYGTGTERVSRELETILPEVKYLRMDRDTTQTKGSHTSILKEFQERRAQILIGTQMVAKGLDFPDVTLVGIINADGIINLPDYQAAERAYQLITQVSGRAGRGEQPGQVVVQTFNPENYLFEAVRAQNYADFFQSEMANRRFLAYPPFYRLIRILLTGFKERTTLEKINQLAQFLHAQIKKEELAVELLGPSPAPLSFLQGRFRYHLILKGASLDSLRELVRLLPQENRGTEETRLIIDVEPQNLL